VNADDDARLLERLLEDPGFRARFRYDAAGAAREAGFGDLAQEIEIDEQAPLETLEIRESRSSVGGVMLAAAAEGLGLFALSEPAEHALAADTPPQRDVPEADSGATRPVVAEHVTEPAADEREPDHDDEQDEDQPDEDEPDEDEPDEDEPDEDEFEEDEVEEDQPEDDVEADQPEADGPEDDDGVTGDADSDDGEDSAREDSNSHDDDGDDSGQTGSGSAGPLRPSVDWRPEPAQYGMSGGGGAQSPFDAAVLKNDKITLDADGKQDFLKGRMDPRVGAMLLRLAETHELTLSSTTSDHPQSTAGGSPSNHWYGRAFDIATVDGEIVRPGSAAARKLATELSRLDPSIRPSEIGSPWAMDRPGYFTDADHQDHIHVGFDQIIDRRWRPPNEARVMPALRLDPRP
jgi:hypothetical protein